jgi:putative glutamine amidotransferase
MQPLIGITCSYDQTERRFSLPEAYVEAVINAGGLPVVLPGHESIKKAAPYLASVKGLLLSGGGDVDPVYFNEEPTPALGEITPARDKFEIMLIKTALKKNIPLLGICRGIQVLNIACGGTVIQHIPNKIKKPLKHSQAAPRSHPTHKVSILKPSLLASILKTQNSMVNSFHHQAVGSPAPDFMVNAVSSDGVIEGIENPRFRFVLGVQWHPECMVKNDVLSRRLFKAFIDACR